MNWNTAYTVELTCTEDRNHLHVSDNMTSEKARMMIDALNYHVIKNIPEIDEEFYDKDYFEGKSEKSGLNNYDKFSRDFAEDHIKNRLEYFLKGDKEQVILEIGCAFGNTVDLLRRSGYKNAYGIDISEYAINKYPADYKRVMNITSEVFTREFDFIYSFAMMEHVAREDMRQTLKNIHKMLKPGGVYFATIDDMWGVDNSHQTIMPREWWNRMFAEEGFIIDKEATGKFENINGYVFRRA